MKIKRRQKEVYLPKDKAVQLAANHNCVSREVAEKYTDSELEEVLRVLSSDIHKFKKGW